MESPFPQQRRLLENFDRQKPPPPPDDGGSEVSGDDTAFTEGLASSDNDNVSESSEGRISIKPVHRRVDFHNEYRRGRGRTLSRDRCQPSRYPHRRSVVHRLYRDRLPPYIHGPPVIWEATIFDAENVSKPRGPCAIYYDDRPLEVKLKPGKTEHSKIVDNNDHRGAAHHLSWDGAVVEVFVTAFAYLPKRPHHFINDGIESSLVEVEYVPPQMDSFIFDRVSRRGIRIKSPFLYNKLCEIIEYYPSFYGTPAGDLLNLSLRSRSEVDTAFYILEPYGVLMHHFTQIEAVVHSIRPEQGMDEDIQEDQISRLGKEHLKHLYDFLEPLYNNQIPPCQEQLDNPSPRVAFAMLWWIYKPGTSVYIQTSGVVHVCIISDIKSNLDDPPSHPDRPSQASAYYAHYPDRPPEAPTYPEYQNPKDDVKYWTLYLWYLDSDGMRIARSQTLCRITAYMGLKEVTSLDACPVSTWDTFDKGERRKKIMTRGRYLLNALQKGFLLARYDGPSNDGLRYYTGTVVIDYRRGLFHNKSAAPIIGNVKDHCPHFRDYDEIVVNESGDLREEILIEEPQDAIRDLLPFRDSYNQVGHSVRTGTTMRAAYVEEPEFIKFSPRTSTRRHKSYSPERHRSSDTEVAPEGKVQVRKDLDDNQVLLLFPKTRAFALKTKQWLVIGADYISEIVPSEESIDNLVVGENELKTIRGLAKRQDNYLAPWTYTVEAIAEWLHRPLLALTVADIGTAETRVERELIKWFTLAEAWNAILLVDEADIFLERRQNRDLARNGLVSAFLRRMEYFRGLLFLTTNRVGQIDDAFISRVHVAIGYKALSGEDRQKIWKGFFRKLAKERAGKIQVATAAKKWVLEMAVKGTAQLNGRDIRNALQTAITLAETECEEDPDFDPSTMTVVVDQSHFQRVLDISNKFHEYVRSIRREDEKKRAAGRFDRNDYWEGES
ncbi:hypothetical protein Egran_01438 [Elaphomyces granulatus]|uniref:ATPase AAA-type core domain-containing protein n=1 Tax=Elaphomyces granulatus TaxID=519963 RepID=A0A232M302_9EURO|nr:hypothetical protein Egran_01438 [Elaphomyces granulatus]